MRTSSSTFRTASDCTLGAPWFDSGQGLLQEVVANEWRRTGLPDLVGTIRRHPELLEQRSLLLNLAIDEFRARRASEGSFDLEHHCGRFRQFGNSIERSIFRQLETQKYIDDHPDLLDVLGEPTWPEVGDSFGSFQVLDELGRGGIARVYLCREADIGNRQVVVKATPFGSFEASILGRLSHPNIVPIFSVGFSDEFGLQYLSMPFRGRSTLSDVIDLAFQTGIPRNDGAIFAAANRWSPPGHAGQKPAATQPQPPLTTNTYVGRILSIGAQLADALAHAHQEGILHGDLKPSNVLLCSDGTALLLDFNLSRDAEKLLAACGGTLSYMPPEELKLIADQSALGGALPNFDARSDIYSFGALMYELLTGRVPARLRRTSIDSSSVARALLGQLQQGVAPPSAYNPFVSRRLDATIMQCLEFRAAERPKSFLDIRQALLRELRPGPSAVRQIKIRPRFYAAIAAICLTASAAFAAYVASRPPQYLAYYHAGLEYAAQGQFVEAIDHFTSSLALRPDFEKGLAARARALLAQKALDLAIKDFSQLARRGDAISMVYMGYCLNLKSMPVGAIAWYERALENGVQSAEVYNNLGATYLLTRDRLSDDERYQRSEELLLKALDLLPKSNAVRLNLLRLETVKPSSNREYDPRVAWQHASYLLKEVPNDLLVKAVVGEWYAAVLNRNFPDQQAAQLLVSVEESTVHRQLTELVEQIAPRKDSTPAHGPKFRGKNSIPKNDAKVASFYLKPSG